MTAVLNRARNYYRHSGKNTTVGLDNAEEFPSSNRSAEQWAILSEQLQLLSKAIGELSPEQREVVSMYMGGGFTFKQIAQIQEVSLSTVQGRFRCGIERLQRLLRNEVTK